MVPPGVAPREFYLYSDAELGALPPQETILKHVIPSTGVGVIFGPSGSGKTFVCLDLAAHIANGMPWFGRRVKQRNVIYIPCEGAGGIAQRRAAWSLHHGRITRIAYLMSGVAFLNIVDRIALVNQLKRQGWWCSVIIIDTLAQAFAGVEENGSEMAKVVEVAQDVARDLGGVVILVHHTGHTETDRMRGWSGLPAAMDFCIACNLPKAGQKRHDRSLTFSKVKDGEAGVTIPFSLQPVHLGLDSDGDPYGSMVVVPSIAAPAKVSDKAEAEGDDEFIWQVIWDAVAAGEYPSGRSLQAAISSFKEKRPGLTTRRIADAIKRLEQVSRVQKMPKAPNGNPWLRAVEAGKGCGALHPPCDEGAAAHVAAP
jgi:RecA/RadA recombinase